MSTSQALIETILFICTLYGGIRFIRAAPVGILRLVFTIYSFNEKRRLARERKNWEIIPDSGGTVEGSLKAAKIFADARFMQRRG